MVIHLLPSLFPLTSVQLGRLVTNANRPNQDHLDPLSLPHHTPPRPAPSDMDVNPLVNYSETHIFSKTSRLRSSLARIVSIQFERHDDSRATLSAPQAKTYDLRNSNKWFREACKEAEVRKFLEVTVDNRRRAYLITGFRTVLDARLEKRLSEEIKKGSTGHVPVRALSSTVVLRTPEGPGMYGDSSGVAASRDTAVGQEISYEAPGEQVFAIEYRKVRVKWHKSRDVDAMWLEQGARWRSCWDWRGYPDVEGQEERKEGDEEMEKDKDDDEDEEDIMEVTLTDESDLEISDDEGKDEEDFRG